MNSHKKNKRSIIDILGTEDFEEYKDEINY